VADSADVERLNSEGLKDFGERAGDASPVLMLNLLAFKPDGGRERYSEYLEAAAPFFEKAGGRLLQAGDPAPVMIGEQSWDLMVLVEYPSRQAFLDMIGSPGYQEIGHLRTEALVRAELHPMDPAEGLPT
jgi:uncharacterized protein (DUF1330 family)